MRTNLPILMAGSAIATIPILIIFLIAQPFFLEPVERKGVSKAESQPKT